MYFREKKTNFYSIREIKITNTKQFNLNKSIKKENNNEINKNIVNKIKSKKLTQKMITKI